MGTGAEEGSGHGAELTLVPGLGRRRRYLLPWSGTERCAWTEFFLATVLLHLHCLLFGVSGRVSVQHFVTSADVRRTL